MKWENRHARSDANKKDVVVNSAKNHLSLQNLLWGILFCDKVTQLCRIIKYETYLVEISLDVSACM